jgi:ABC-type transporter Mla subunit MlaD
MTPPETPPELDDTIVRLPLLPSPAEMEDMRDRRTRITEELDQQTRTAVRSVAEAAAAFNGAGDILNRAVAAARAAGATWSDIGRAVGISRQAAAERWSK